MSCPGKESSAQTNHQKKRIAIYSDHDRIQVKEYKTWLYMNYKILIFLKGKYQMKTCVDIKYIFINLNNIRDV